MACEFCGSPAHVWFNCTKKPDGWKPERLKQSTAERKVAPSGAVAPKKAAVAGTQAPPVETKKRGRPRIHPDRKAYKAANERERRAKLKSKK